VRPRLRHAPARHRAPLAARRSPIAFELRACSPNRRLSSSRRRRYESVGDSDKHLGLVADRN
jgi:hypothetical protein